MIEKNNIIADWLDRHGDPEIDKFVETQLTQNEMKKQTAVEWLIRQIKGYESDCEIFEEALAMEKEQIIESWKHGNLPTFLGKVLTAEQYYNETFKSE